MTDAEMAVAASKRLTQLCMRALEMHWTKGTREWVVRAHNRWQYELNTIDFDNEPLSDDRRDAFLELDEATSTLIEERGQDPDSILHWVDMYPSIVLNVHLRVPQPNTT